MKTSYNVRLKAAEEVTERSMGGMAVFAFEKEGPTAERRGGLSSVFIILLKNSIDRRRPHVTKCKTNLKCRKMEKRENVF